MNLKSRIKKIEKLARPKRNITYVAHSIEEARKLCHRYAQQGIYVRSILIAQEIKKQMDAS